MHMEIKIARMTSALDLSFEQALEWIEQRNQVVSRVIRREFIKLKSRNEPAELPEDMTIEEATRIYKEMLKPS